MTDEEFDEYMSYVKACNQMAWYKHVICQEAMYNDRMKVEQAWELAP